ncbi:MAG TPA: hypothetical protein ENO14_00670 [Chromatiales bacterium]|nr:hypothetical protein [Chromatiales bacterium]
MRYAIIPLVFVSALLVSCSNESNPVGASAPSGVSTELLEAYVYMSGGAQTVLTTSSSRIAVRFWPYVSRDMQDGVLARFGASRKMEFSIFSLVIAATDDAFALAPRLSMDPRVQYVGPVFETACGLEVPGNEFIVRGDISGDDVPQLLAAAGARIVSTRPDDPKRFLMSVPWGDARDLYELVDRLDRSPGIVYAQPNHAYQVCLR